MNGVAMAANAGRGAAVRSRGSDAPHCGSRPTALVFGGGLAGISAAIALTDVGWRVTLLESRKHLGGRATSHVDPRTGRMFDNCQHVLLRRCTRMIGLLARLGALAHIEWHDAMHFVDPNGRHDVLRAAPLPAPLHLAPSLLRCGFLSAAAKVAVTQAMIEMMAAGADPKDEISFGEWLRRRAQPPEAVERFWSTIVVSALNEDVDRVSAAAAANVFREAFFRDRTGYHVGVPRVPLGQLYQKVSSILYRTGGTLLVGTPASGVDLGGQGRVTGVICGDGRRLSADAYVCALPPERVLKVLPAAVVQADSRFAALERLDFSPIIGIHLWFQRRVLHLPHAALVASPLHWLFDRGVDAEGVQHLHGVISAARQWCDLPPEKIVAAAQAEVERYFPPARSARLIRGEALKERKATISLAPGVEALRPGAAGTIENLFLAGDYCATGWPATMEGAVRSGELAAAAARRCVEREVQA